MAVKNVSFTQKYLNFDQSTAERIGAPVFAVPIFQPYGYGFCRNRNIFARPIRIRITLPTRGQDQVRPFDIKILVIFANVYFKLLQLAVDYTHRS